MGTWILIIIAWANWGKVVSVTVTPGLNETACKGAASAARQMADNQSDGKVFTSCVRQ